MKKTPLYENHCKLNGRMIDFGGWSLPVEYTGIIEEHRQVRNAAGLFDVSHMGEITVKGKDATQLVQKLITNNIAAAKEFQVVYSPMCYLDGGVVDDLLVYKYSNENYLLVVNASNTEKDFEWIRQNLEGQVAVENVSDAYAQLAIQGPKAETVLQKLAGTALNEIKFFYFKPDVMLGEVKAILSRTGYTGEDGFEIYIPAENAAGIWEQLLAAGKEEGIVPVGLGARDTLRFEAALPLYGHELSMEITPLEAGLGNFVKLNKENFNGMESLSLQHSSGLKRTLVGFEMLGRGIPRNNYEVSANGRTVGKVTSGSYSPSLDKNIGMALVEAGCSAEGTEVDILIREKPIKARIIKLPFYTKKYRKQ